MFFRMVMFSPKSVKMVAALTCNSLHLDEIHERYKTLAMVRKRLCFGKLHRNPAVGGLKCKSQFNVI